MKHLRVKESGSHFGIRDAIALNPTAFCEGCNRVVREKEMQGDICFACYVEYKPKGGGGHKKAKSKEHGGEGAPARNEGRERNKKTLVGQLTLSI